MSAIVQANGLSVRLGGREVVADVSFSVNAGEVVGLIGPNGSGKSTCISALAGIRKPSSGGVTLDGEALERVAPRVRARSVSYLPQNPECHWPLSVRQVVALGRLPHRSLWGGLGVGDAAAIERAMAKLEVAELAERRVDRLSGGERMRVMLARALAPEPRVLLVDEPTDGLDPNHQLHVMELLRASAAEGCAVLAVLHDLSLAERFCDRLLLLHEGRLLAAGPPREVLVTENVARAYRVEAVVLGENGRSTIVPWRRIGR
jgi:iron complex transport system ATP-binding protein